MVTFVIADGVPEEIQFEEGDLRVTPTVEFSSIHILHYQAISNQLSPLKEIWGKKLLESFSYLSISGQSKTENFCHSW